MISMRKSVKWIYWIGSGLLFVSALFLGKQLLGWSGDWKSAVIMDERGNIIYADNETEKLPPASTIKVVTAMVVVDNVGLNKWVEVSKNAAAVEPTKVYLRVGEKYRIRDLIYAMLMGSANDAAVVLAEAVSKSERRFADKMMQKLRRCGIKGAVITNASGLPDRLQKISALDLVKLMRIAIRYGIICDALSKKVFYFSDKDGKRKIRVVNHNKLLWNRCWSFVKGKTGFTRSAGQCFLGYFWYKGRYYVFCFLGGKTLWKNIRELVRKVVGRRKCL